ncbi:MAG: ABC transporter substrate-binding protein [Deltaproteobacteria bacterium]|nr:ABC transporter substrate-binding protein [Deltaproteobacteria bacterium]
MKKLVIFFFVAICLPASGLRPGGPVGLCAETPPVHPYTGPAPRRIISLGQTITERIYLLGADKNLIANTVYCVEPEDARHKEKVGTLLQANIEKIVAMKPDLVIATNLASPRQLRKLRDLGIRVVQFSYPENFEEMCEQFLELGRLLGREKEAEEIIDKTRRDVAAIRMKTAALPKKRVFIQLGVKPLHAVTGESFLNDYIEFAGGINIALRDGHGTYSREKVLKGDPEVIIISTMGSSEGETGRKEKEVWMKYRSIAAVRNRQVYLVNPDKLCSPTPLTFVEGLKEITGMIHPELEIGGAK